MEGMASVNEKQRFEVADRQGDGIKNRRWLRLPFGRIKDRRQDPHLKKSRVLVVDRDGEQSVYWTWCWCVGQGKLLLVE